MKKQKRIIFIGGVHRSGTSQLHEILKLHPRISGLQNTGKPEDEGQHVQAVYPIAAQFGGPGVFGFRKESHMNEAHSLVSEENASKILTAWETYLDKSLPIYVEKSPPNIVRTRFLQALFPDCLHIVLLRHPITTALATARLSSFQASNFISLVEHTLQCYERFAEDRSHLKNCLVLRYEDIPGESSDRLDRLWDFVGVTPIPSNFFQPARNKRYIDAWDNTLRSFADGGEQCLASFRALWEHRTNAFGYSMENCTTTSPISWIG